MKKKNFKNTDKDMALVVKRALDAVIKKAKAEPVVILEIEANNTEDPETMGEIGSWLFHRR
jgi:hypothetical protein